MITVLHGDNQLQSRKELLLRIFQAREKGREVQHFLLEGLTLAMAETALSSSGLFSLEKLIVFEGFLGSTLSWKKDVLSLAEQAEYSVIFWEGKVLKAAVLSLLPPQIEVRSFTPSTKIWAWLDSIRPGNGSASIHLLDEATRTDDVEFCFVMLIRQLRLLLQQKDSSSTAGSFAAKKTAHQAQLFTMEKLLGIQSWLLRTDLAQKSGTATLPLRQQLDLLLLSL